MSSPAKSGPPTDPPKPPPPKPPPRWLNLLWLVGLLVTVLVLFPLGSSQKKTSLTFTAWKTKVDANQVKTASIDTSGRVSGELNDKKKTPYTSRIPTALNDNTLSADLEAHHVNVKGTTTGTSFLSIIGGLLPFILLLGVYLWISRRATRQLTGGIAGIGSSRAKVYDEE